jgi:hypothetical protein
MISEKQVNLINKIASKETFKYTGELIQGVDQPADIDYKFRITGHRKMMSVGEYYDFLLLEVTITGANDPVSKLIFTPQSTDTGKAVARMFESQLYGFYSRLNQEIMNYLRYFNDSEEEFVRTTIDDLKWLLTYSLYNDISDLIILDDDYHNYYDNNYYENDNYENNNHEYIVVDN